MPYEWSDTKTTRTLTLWPHNSIEPRGFVWFIGATAALLLLPLLAVLGSPILWALLPFLVGALVSIWWAIARNKADRQNRERLDIGPTHVTLLRQDKHQTRDWRANRHWVRLSAQPKGGPVDHYLTLEGGPRRVELGAFLTTKERQALQTELDRHLRPQ